MNARRVTAALVSASSTAALVLLSGIGCEKLSGVGDLIIDSVEVDGQVVPPDGAHGDEGGEGEGGAIGDSGTTADTAAPPDDGAVPPGDGSIPDGNTPDGTLTCAAPAKVDGSLTPCVKSSTISTKFPNCVAYCQSLGQCCAENCQPLATDPGILAAEWGDVDEAHCDDPGLSGGSPATAEACSFSPTTNAPWIRCCCGR